MSDDMSPDSLPFSTRVREIIAQESENLLNLEPPETMFQYVDLAKRILLELRVRNFTASDVVALASTMEARDRHFGGEA